MINDFGLYDSLTIILHGDHGSRIRFLNRNERVAREKLLDSTSVTPRVSRYDYVSKPQLQDLLNRFSILLAVKPPGATEPLIIEKKGSILSLLWSEAMSLVDVSVKESDTNYVFLFDARGLPRKIDILRIWEEEEMKTP